MAFEAFEQAGGLVQTRFLPPLPRTDVFIRPRLTQTLHKMLSNGNVLLVSAPAGFGKTTLISTLPLILPRLQMAWLSVDEEDNDPLQFVMSLAAALRQLHSTVGQR